MNPAATDRYAAIERMYSQGQWQQVLDASEALLASLQGNDNPSLRQRLLLLQGHTRLHGLQQHDAAITLYQQVLDSQPEPVLLAVAQHELDRARSLTTVMKPTEEPVPGEPVPSQAESPDHAFPFTAAAVGTPPAGQASAAAPWLEGLSQPEPEPAAQAAAERPTAAPPWVSEPAAAATLTPVELIEEPEQIAVHQADPTSAEIVDLVDLAPWSPAEEAELARGLLEVVLR